MATFTNDDFTAMKHLARRDATLKAEMATAALSKQSWKDTLQALEDWWQAPTQQTAIKATMDTAAGVTLSNVLAKKLGNVWQRHKSGEP